MKMHQIPIRTIAVAAAYGAVAVMTQAVVVEFTDKDEWLVAVGPVTTVGFTEFPDNTFITDQYESLGVLFSDGVHQIACCGGFPEDGAGLYGFPAIHMVFESPQAYLAADFPCILQIELFSGGELVYQSGVFGSSGCEVFAGVISSSLFDAANLKRPPDLFNTAIDDLHFGVAGPAGDLDGDWLVGVSDLLLLLGAWGPCPDPPDPCAGDLDADGIVGVGDLLIVLANWSV